MTTDPVERRVSRPQRAQARHGADIVLGGHHGAVLKQRPVPYQRARDGVDAILLDDIDQLLGLCRQCLRGPCREHQRKRQHLFVFGGGRFVPKAAVTPAKWTDLDTKKSIATDWLFSYDTIAHRASGSVAGLNALFPDGHVTFQNARSNPQDFDPLQWGQSQSGPGNYIGVNQNYFRYVMSLWQP